jgi:hypothetical protein
MRTKQEQDVEAKSASLQGLVFGERPTQRGRCNNARKRHVVASLRARKGGPRQVIRLRLPMRATVQVARLPLDAKVEISAIAVK